MNNNNKPPRQNLGFYSIGMKYKFNLGPSIGPKSTYWFREVFSKIKWFWFFIITYFKVLNPPFFFYY